MAKRELEGRRIAVLAADGFEQVELTGPLKQLRKRGAEVCIISLKPGKIRGVNGLVPGKKVHVAQTIFSADPETFDALFIPGGLMSPDLMRQSGRMLRFVQAFETAKKPIAAICHGPWLLASAQLLNGRRLTSWPGIADDLRNAGAHWEDAPLVRDDNWVTSRGPHDLPAFEKGMVELFAEAPASARVPRRRWGKRLVGSLAAGAALYGIGKRLRSLNS